jgi:hypothetical protein
VACLVILFSCTNWPCGPLQVQVVFSPRYDEEKIFPWHSHWCDVKLLNTINSSLTTPIMVCELKTSVITVGLMSSVKLHIWFNIIYVISTGTNWAPTACHCAIDWLPLLGFLSFCCFPQCIRQGNQCHLMPGFSLLSKFIYQTQQPVVISCWLKLLSVNVIAIIPWFKS